MLNRFCFGALLIACLALPFTGCNNASTGLDSISISPNASLQLVVGNPATIQLTVTGTFGNGKHPTTGPVANVTWTSAIPNVATVSSTGLVSAGVTAGNTTITATAQGFNGPVTATVEVTVVGGTGSGTGTTSYPVNTLTIIPSSQSVAIPGDTSQFIVIGTDSTGATEDLTGLAAWTSSSPQIATIGSAAITGTIPGLATAVGKGTVTITAEYTNISTSTVATGTALFTVVSGGGSQSVTALSLIPGSETLSASGQSGQFIALATMGSTGLIEDVTNSPQITWSSNVPSIATVSSTLAPTQTCAPVCANDPPGMAKGVNAGSATITAEWTNPASGSTPSNVVNATASVSVTNTPPPEPITSLTIIPGTLTVGNIQGSGQFLAIGTFSTAPYVRDLTDSVTWISSFPNIFPVDTNTGGNTGASAGIVTAYGNGSTTIIAEASSGGASPSIQTATATFSCPLVLPCPCTVAQGCASDITSCPNGPIAGSCYPGSQGTALLSTVTVYNEGVNTTNWLVTAPSATGTPNVVHCGPGWTGAGGSVCVQTYPTNTGTPVVFTATQTGGGTGTFGGWSNNCTPVVSPTNLTPTTPTANGPNYCELNPTTFNETLGAIFN
ncbi:MAG: Ig-like domain-containing protein [Terracidiphilus sp.]